MKHLVFILFAISWLELLICYACGEIKLKSKFDGQNWVNFLNGFTKHKHPTKQRLGIEGICRSLVNYVRRKLI